MAEEEDTTGGQPSLSPGDVLVMTAENCAPSLIREVKVALG